MSNFRPRNTFRIIKIIQKSLTRAHDGTNNLFKLAYEMLSWKVHRALIKAKLEPYLGFLH
ncbi:hypothetical protein DRO66_08965 [Candidatus Bathyarchaeota archaeon]|nr:MAG: hypothetical protein DRO66_08965 [Candidatus Bathyarchaeota archaeon]